MQAVSQPVRATDEQAPYRQVMLKKANGFHESVNNECDLTSVFNRFLEPQDFLTGFLLLTGRGSSCVATIVFHASLYIFDVHVQPMEKIFKGSYTLHWQVKTL